MTTNGHIGAIPEELLFDILQRVNDNPSANPLVHCLPVNRLFNRISTPLFYQSIFLHNSTLKSSIISLKAHRDQITTLRIRIKPCEVETYTLARRPSHIRTLGKSRYHLEHTGRKATRALSKALQAFCIRALPYLKNLSTFSVIVEHPHESRSSPTIEPPLEVAPPTTFRFPPSIPIEVLLNLPSSVENLELNVGESEFPDGKNASNHTCALLRKHLPQLRNVRLRLDSLCPALFYENDEDDYDYGDDSYYEQTPVKAPYLESLVTNVDIGRGCSASACRRRDPDDGHFWLSYKIRDPEDPQWWLAVCEKAVQAGTFPKLQHLGVYGITPA